MKKRFSILFLVVMGIISCIFAVTDSYDLLHKISELIIGLLSIFIGYMMYKEY